MGSGEAAAVALSRRERLRAQAIAEITGNAMAILDTNGAEAVTLAAIAKTMGMSAPGLYRYFESRDALIDRLLQLVHEQLADALERTAAETAGLSPGQRLRANAHSYRQWALQHPMRFDMLFGVASVRHGDLADRPGLAAAAAAADRGMGMLIEITADLHHGAPVTDVPADQLNGQLLASWRRRTGRAVSPQALRLAITTWTRLHGIVSLEISGAFAALDADAALLLDSEIDALLAHWDAGS